MTDPDTLRDIKEQYDEWAPTYNRDARRWGYCTPWKVANRLTPHLKPGMDVVELACGTGLNGAQYQYLDLNLVGVDASAKMLKKARKEGIPVIGEVELAYKVCRAPIIAITGTKGKSTTSTLLGLILEKAHTDGNTIVAGNIGKHRKDGIGVENGNHKGAHTDRAIRVRHCQGHYVHSIV